MSTGVGEEGYAAHGCEGADVVAKELRVHEEVLTGVLEDDFEAGRL